MKIIELLNKIANGEEVPKKIKYYDEEFVFTGYDSASKNYNGELNDLFEVLDGSVLNDTIEILEEEKKIPEKIYYHGDDAEKRIIIGKLDEIIDYLKSKGE